MVTLPLSISRIGNGFIQASMMPALCHIIDRRYGGKLYGAAIGLFAASSNLGMLSGQLALFIEREASATKPSAVVLQPVIKIVNLINS